MKKGWNFFCFPCFILFYFFGIYPMPNFSSFSSPYSWLFEYDAKKIQSSSRILMISPDPFHQILNFILPCGNGFFTGFRKHCSVILHPPLRIISKTCGDIVLSAAKSMQIPATKEANAKSALRVRPYANWGEVVTCSGLDRMKGWIGGMKGHEKEAGIKVDLY